MKRKLILGLTLITASMITLSSCSIINSLKKTDKKEDKECYANTSFGKYPQTKVTKESLIQELNIISGPKPTATYKYLWTDYNYYYNGVVTSYMYYQDIDYDNDGDYDYRGVYFTKYRPVLTTDTEIDESQLEKYSNQHLNGYDINTIYWFKYETIKWNIVDENDGKKMLVSSLVLDSQEYYPSVLDDEQFYHNGGIGYANNYALSNIRKFINNDFYNTAFTDSEKEKIETTLVDNSLESTDGLKDKCICEDTYDKIFLLSCKEFKTYFDYSIKKWENTRDDSPIEATDYAKCQGIDKYFPRWLRSPGVAGGIPSANVIKYASVYSALEKSDWSAASYIGVDPACWVKL